MRWDCQKSSPPAPPHPLRSKALRRDLSPPGRGAAAYVLAPLLVCSTTVLAQAEADHAAIAEASLEQYIRPGYAHLAESTEALNQSVAALCAKPSAAALKDARSLRRHGGSLEHGRAHPLRSGGRGASLRPHLLLAGPQRPRRPPGARGARQRGRDAELKPRRSAKSVALQGLPALEYLLYGDDADTLAKGGGKLLPLPLRQNCRRQRRWHGQGHRFRLAGRRALRQGLSRAGPDNAAYHTEKEVTLELFKTFVTGIETVRDQKMAKALGAKSEEARPQLAPFWRSDLSFANMADNLQSARDLFKKGGFAQVVHDDLPASRIRSSSTSTTLSRCCGAEQADHQAVHNEDVRAKLEALRVSLKSAATTAGDIISRAPASPSASMPWTEIDHGVRSPPASLGFGDQRRLWFGVAPKRPRRSLSCSPPPARTIVAPTPRRCSPSTAAMSRRRAAERGHDIALRPGSREWVAFARRPGRFGVAVPTTV